MKVLGSLKWQDDWSQKQPALDKDYDLYLRTWNALSKKNKFGFVLVSAQWFKGKAFSKYWQLGRSGTWEKVNKKLLPDALHDMSRSFDFGTGEIVEERYLVKEAINEHVPITNHPKLRRLLDSKLYQAVVFSGFMPRSVLVSNGQTYKNPKSKSVVVKGFGGNRGRFVEITKKKQIKADKPVLVQEFVNARSGGEVQDFRIHFIGEKPMYCYSRVAAPGTLYTNVGQGGSYYFISLKEVPDLLEVSHEILQRLDTFGKKELCLDFMRDTKTKTPYLIEANAVPGTKGFSVQLLKKLQNELTTMIFK